MILFLLFRSKEISGQLLNNADTALLKWLKIALHGQYAVMVSDEWKDELRSAVNGVNISVGGKVSYFLDDLILKLTVWFERDIPLT